MAFQGVSFLIEEALLRQLYWNQEESKHPVCGSRITWEKIQNTVSIDGQGFFLSLN